MKCPKCGQALLQKQGDTVRVRIRLMGPLLIKEDGCHAVCFWCKEPVIIPLYVKTKEAIPEERFYLGKPTTDKGNTSPTDKPLTK